jgi:hypothetical protein
MAAVLEVLSRGLPLEPLPPAHKRDEAVSHAPVRRHSLTAPEQRVSTHLTVFTFFQNNSDHLHSNEDQVAIARLRKETPPPREKAEGQE